MVGACLRLRFDDGQIEKLKRLAAGSCLEVLGYVVNLDSGRIVDSLRGNGDVARVEFEVLHVLLKHYANSEPVERNGTLVKFADLPGGYAYEKAFLQRAVLPVAEAFGEKPERLVESAERLRGRVLTFGDCSVEIAALPRLPLTIIVWRRSEFPAQASVLYDQTANQYLPTEDLAVLGELTTARLTTSIKH